MRFSYLELTYNLLDCITRFFVWTMPLLGNVSEK